MPYEPIVPDGCHLGTSHGPDGGVNGLLFENGTNRLIGHASWHWVDEDDADTASASEQRPLTQGEQELAAAVAAVLVVALIAAMPVVKRWWGRTAFPAMQATWRRLARRVRALRKQRRAQGQQSPSDAIAADAVAEVADSTITMSAAEWASRHAAMLAAGAFSDEQRRVLSMARIVEPDVARDQQLTASQFAERIQLKLQANPAALEGTTSARVIEQVATATGTKKALLQLER